MITLQPVQPHQRELLWNINQKYLYEMTNFYDDPMDECGNYHYGHFEEYFTDPRREALFIVNGQTPVGFAFICPYSNIGQEPDYTMAEFTIFPAYRRKHFAREAAAAIITARPGKWEIKFNEKNLPAKRLWTAVTEAYGPKVHHLNDVETVLVFEVK